MALDLDSEKAIDYSSNDPFLPYEALGDYVFDISSYVKFEGHNGDGDLAVLTVVESSRDDIKPGERYAFMWRTDIKGDGKAFAEARLRSFVMAAVGVEVKNARTFKAGKAREDMLAEDYSTGGNLIRLKRGEKPAKEKPEARAAREAEGRPVRMFSDDHWSPVKA